jgi:TonB-linked SusC/RagA family outer membrane protein
MFKNLLTLLVFALLSGNLYAQVSISGTVTDAETGETLPGVNILITELSRGAATDVDGNYTVNNVPSGTYTVRATFVGYQTYSATLQVDNQNVNFDIVLESDLIGLDDVVVTAFGIQRERRALGYGVAEVSAETIDNKNNPDLARSLAGNLPGVDISTTGGLTGSGTDITIRGSTSLSGSNAPLWIVDGVQFDGGSNETSDWYEGGGSTVTPNRFIDLDPNNIADVTVLKGLSATVLYGEGGRNGVIIVTTKTGNLDAGSAPSGFDITIDQSVYSTEISSRPDYQNTYGGGFDQNFGWFYSNWGPKFSTDNPALFGTNFLGLDNDGTILIKHPLMQHPATADGFPEFDHNAGYKGYRYEAKQDPLDAFFKTGTAATTSLNISGGFNNLRVNANYSHSGEDGFTPNNNLKRDAFSIGALYKINERLTSNTTFNMSLTEMNTPPSAAGTGSGTFSGTAGVFSYVMFTPRSIDLGGMPYENPINGGSAYYRSGNGIPNPRWVAENTGITNLTDRFYGKTEFIFKMTDNLSLTYRLGYDGYTEQGEYRQAANGVEPDYAINGFLQNTSQRKQAWDHNLIAIFNTQINENISFDGTFGAQYETEEYSRTGIESVEMIVQGFFNHSNFLDQTNNNSLGLGNRTFQRETANATAGVYASTTIGFQDFIYVNLSGRNDWFSTLEVDNRSIFYPSANVSYVITDHLDISSDALTYLKVFAGVGTSAGQPPLYSTRNTLGTTARAFNLNGIVTTNFTSDFLGNPNLKPELHTEYEAGLDIRFLNGKLGLSASAYTRSTTDLITEADLDPATGFTSTFTNIGEVENKGLELSLSATPLDSDLRWEVNANFFKNISEVLDIGADFKRIQIGTGFQTRGNFAIVGESYGVMLGSKIERVTQELKDKNSNFEKAEIGTPLIGPTGNYIEQNDIGIIGDPTPDFDLTLSNTFNYKGASLSFQIDYQKGGDMFSTWISTLMARGLTTDTDKVDRNNTFILPGVSAETGETNRVQISPSGVFFSNFGFGPDELRVYDMTHIRLANVAISYSIPASLISNTPFKAITLSLTGDNLWMYAFNVPEGSGFDPNVNSIGGNNRGFDYLTGPAARRFGGSVKIKL